MGYKKGLQIGSPTFEKIQFSGVSEPDYSEGLLFYDSDKKTFSAYIDRENVTLNIGEEQWLRVVNKSGGDFINGQIVYISDVQGNRPVVSLAQADALATSQYTIAVLTEDIDNNDEGIATTFGIVRNYNTSTFTTGDELYLSPTTPGLITNVMPTAPDFNVRIGWALDSTVNGSILVNIHVNGDGTIFTYIDQDVTAGASPVFAGIKVGDISGGNYLEVESDGTLEFNGNATVWDDVRVPLEKGKLAGGSNPTFEKFKDNGSGSNGVYAYNFSDGNELFFSLQMPHSWKLGSTVYPHFHIASKTDGSGKKIKLGFEYTWQSIHGTFGNTTVETRDVDLDTAYKHLIFNVPSAGVSGTGMGLSSMLFCRVYREAADSDNFAGDVYFLEWDMHYEQDTVGSRQVTTK